MKAYIGVERCCGAISASMLDDEETTAKAVAEFASKLHKTHRDLRHVDVPPNAVVMQSCECHNKHKAGPGV